MRGGSGVGLEGSGAGCVDEPRSALEEVESDVARKKLTVGGSISIAKQKRTSGREHLHFCRLPSVSFFKSIFVSLVVWCLLYTDPHAWLLYCDLPSATIYGTLCIYFETEEAVGNGLNSPCSWGYRTYNKDLCEFKISWQ